MQIGRPIAYLSKALKGRKLVLPTYEKGNASYFDIYQQVEVLFVGPTIYYKNRT